LPLKDLNEASFDRYVRSNPLVPRNVTEGCQVFNELLPHARYRPVTPVGQLLWNQHVYATEAALYHRLTPQAALDQGTAIVQRDLDRILNPVPGQPIRWTWFFVVYGLMLVGAAAAVYAWDTRLDLRRRVARVLRLEGRRADGVVEGARGGYFRQQWRGGWLCAAPWIAGFVVFGGGPMLFSLLMSFCDYDILNPPRFVGLHNFRWMFTEDRLLPLSLVNTLFMVIGVPLGMALSLAVALLLNLKIRGMAVWRTFFYLPAIVPMVASSILWIWIFNPQGGLINQALHLFGRPGPLWLQSPQWSKPAIILMGLWGAGGGMIIWLAGLKGIDQQLYEAAGLDGANAWQRFRHITIPQLTPYIFFNLVMGLIGTFQIFGQAFIMTQGGPDNSTLFYVYHLFNNAFRYGHMGYASAMAWVLFILVLVVTVFQLKGSKRWVYYEAE
jgi:multiple sugar transport system permease protein